MVNYGNNKDFHIHIEHVDYYPELAGIKISNFPTIVSMSMLPLWFDNLTMAIAIFLTLISFFYHAARKEDEGSPLMLNSTFISLVSAIPFRKALIPAAAAIKPHQNLFRR